MKFRRVCLISLFVGFAALAGCLADPLEDDSSAALRGVAKVTLKPGDNLRKIIEKSPAGTVFVLEPGVYRRQTIYPKDKQTFIAKPGAILNGAMVLDAWRKDGGDWVADGLPKQLRPHGKCRKGFPTCRFREDLFVDGKLYTRVLDRDALAAGHWFYQNQKAYLRDDPTGKLVELSVTPLAIGGKGRNVTLRNLVVEKYASQSQVGAIDGRKGQDWKLINLTVRWNHGVGVYINNGTVVRGGFFGYNGQLGLGGAGDHAVIENAEIAYNNYGNYAYAWESGGFKFVRSNGMKIRNLCVHHNNGVGIWNDIDNINTLIEGNTVFQNARIGILQEISYAAIIRNNIVAQNASDRDPWLWGSQILVQNSQNVRVHDNIVEVAAGYGNGISIIHQNRGDGAYGTYLSQNNTIQNNRIVHLGARGRSGMVADFQQQWFFKEGKNIFDRNHYTVPEAAKPNWAIDGKYVDWRRARELGLEVNGVLQVKRVSPLRLSCPRQGSGGVR